MDPIKDPIPDVGVGEEKTQSMIFCMKEEGYTLLKVGVSFHIFSCTAVMIWAYLLLGSAGVSEMWAHSLSIQGN